MLKNLLVVYCTECCINIPSVRNWTFTFHCKYLVRSLLLAVTIIIWFYASAFVQAMHHLGVPSTRGEFSKLKERLKDPLYCRWSFLLVSVVHFKYMYMYVYILARSRYYCTCIQWFSSGVYVYLPHPLQLARVSHQTTEWFVTSSITATLFKRGPQSSVGSHQPSSGGLRGMIDNSPEKWSIG